MGKMQQVEPGSISGEPAMYHHGGNLNSAARAFPGAAKPWIDLSTGINPVPYPFELPSVAAWTRLPEAGATARLEAIAGSAWGARVVEGIVAAPGTQAIIQWLPRLVPARSVGILGFTYGEHAAVWRAAGADVAVVADVGALAAFDVAIVVNPNNPDGRVVPVPDLLALAQAMVRHGGLLVVDEAFADVLPASTSLVSQMPKAGALVMRSFGKTYGLAGIRLGFAIAAPTLAETLRAALGPWAVSGPAAEIAGTALADAGWLAATVARLQRDAARLDGILTLAGFEDICGTPLFRLTRHRKAQPWFVRLGRAGILVRPFAELPDLLRFGLPEPQDWKRVEAALVCLKNGLP